MLEKFSLHFQLMFFSNQETQISLLRVVSRVHPDASSFFKIQTLSHIGLNAFVV
jgi:hypothetical protein